MAGWQQFLRPPIANLKTKILDLLSDFQLWRIAMQMVNFLHKLQRRFHELLASCDGKGYLLDST